jgi:hypothetical protein
MDIRATIAILDIIRRDMRYTLLTALVLVFAAANPAAAEQTIASSTAPDECLAILAPSRQDVEPWLAGSAHSQALKFHLKGLHDRAAAEFTAVWSKVSTELSKAFATQECDYEGVNAVLNRRVFKAPPDAIPMEEDFGMPLFVAMAAADSACRAGDVKSAIAWLGPAADSGNAAALAALVVLESISSPGTAVARITAADAVAPEVALAGCLASTRAGSPDAAWCTEVHRTHDGRQAMQITDLISGAGRQTSNEQDGR